MTPSSVTVGLNMGAIVAFLFLIANLYNFLNLFNLLFSPKKQWKFLKKMKNSWHYVHYFGNIGAFILLIVHVSLLGRFASFLHWIVLAFMGVMVVVGFTMRFLKTSPKTKQKLFSFHAHWYMFLILLVLIIVAHILSLSGFPYKLG
jgi:cytochrome b561